MIDALNDKTKEGIMNMSNKISFSAIAAMAALSMVSLTACSDENTTSPSNELSRPVMRNAKGLFKNCLLEI